jgi:hypothetical protein
MRTTWSALRRPHRRRFQSDLCADWSVPAPPGTATHWRLKRGSQPASGSQEADTDRSLGSSRNGEPARWSTYVTSGAGSGPPYTMKLLRAPPRGGLAVLRQLNEGLAFLAACRSRRSRSAQGRSRFAWSPVSVPRPRRPPPDDVPPRAGSVRPGRSTRIHRAVPSAPVFRGICAGSSGKGKRPRRQPRRPAIVGRHRRPAPEAGTAGPPFMWPDRNTRHGRRHRAPEGVRFLIDSVRLCSPSTIFDRPHSAAVARPDGGCRAAGLRRRPPCPR